MTRAMSFDHESLGIDLDRAKSFPVCSACRKQSDSARTAPDGTVLCGTHYDEWLALYQYAMLTPAAAFAQKLREGKYRPCWEVDAA